MWAWDPAPRQTQKFGTVRGLDCRRRRWQQFVERRSLPVDSERFDDAVRRLSSQLPRRRLLGGFIGTVLAAGPVAFSRDAATKKKRKKKKKRPTVPPVPIPGCVPACAGKNCGDDGCGGVCGTCGGGRVCLGGSCDCPNGTTVCSGVCTDTQTDEANCGTCGTACAATEVCQIGRCFPRSTCPATASFCADLPSCHATDPDGCFCGTTIEGNTVCAANQVFCTGGFTNCQRSAECTAPRACIDISGCCGPGAGTLPAGTGICLLPCADPQ